MKHCPSCNRIYQDETLRFCLDDGTLLVSRPDSEPTMVGAPPPILPATTAWQNPSQAAPPIRASQTSILTYAVVALVALLALLLGGGIVFLLKPPGSSSESNSSAATASPSPTRADNRPFASPEFRNGNQSTAANSYDSIEESVVRGDRIGRSDLATLSQVELRRLRNAIYARHGRMFNTPELQRYFDSRPWYTRRFDYNDRDLTAADKVNLNLIVINEGVP
jgi:hypothetical protein